MHGEQQVRCRTAPARRAGSSSSRDRVARGAELALLVELAVLGQVALGHDAEHPPAVDDDRGVEQPAVGLAGARRRRSRDAARRWRRRICVERPRATPSSSACWWNRSSIEYPDRPSSGKIDERRRRSSEARAASAIVRSALKLGLGDPDVGDRGRHAGEAVAVQGRRNRRLPGEPGAHMDVASHRARERVASRLSFRCWRRRLGAGLRRALQSIPTAPGPTAEHRHGRSRVCAWGSTPGWRGARGASQLPVGPRQPGPGPGRSQGAGRPGTPARGPAEPALLVWRAERGSGSFQRGGPELHPGRFPGRAPGPLPPSLGGGGRHRRLGGIRPPRGGHVRREPTGDRL